MSGGSTAPHACGSAPKWCRGNKWRRGNKWCRGNKSERGEAGGGRVGTRLSMGPQRMRRLCVHEDHEEEEDAADLRHRPEQHLHHLHRVSARKNSVGRAASVGDVLCTIHMHSPFCAQSKAPTDVSCGSAADAFHGSGRVQICAVFAHVRARASVRACVDICCTRLHTSVAVHLCAGGRRAGAWARDVVQGRLTRRVPVKLMVSLSARTPIRDLKWMLSE